jgi:hypothetical protein
VELQEELEREFMDLLRVHGLTDPEVLDSVEMFDEYPVFTRFSELRFLEHLEVVDRNRFLIRATAKYLESLFQLYEGDGTFLRFATITDWWVDLETGGGICTDGRSHLLVPHLWIGNMSHPNMQGYKVYLPSSPCADFVRESIESTRLSVFESSLYTEEWGCPTRVYIGSSATMANQFSAYVAEPPSAVIDPDKG